MRRDRNVGAIPGIPQTDLAGFANPLLGGLNPSVITAIGEVPGTPPVSGTPGVVTAYDHAVAATGGVIAYWPLSEPAGSVAFELLAGRHGAYQGGCTFAAAGAGSSSKAVVLDGASGYVSVPSNSAFNAGLQLTVELWFQMNGRIVIPLDGAADEMLLTRFDGVTSIGYALYILDNGVPNEWLYVLTGDASGGTAASVAWNPDLSWHHLVGTSDQTWLDLWLDGTQIIHTASSLTATSTADSKPIYIGHSVAGDDPQFFADSYFNGAMQRVALYDLVLNPSTIAAHYAAGIV